MVFLKRFGVDWIYVVLILFACVFGYVRGRIDEAELQRKLRAKLYELRQG